MMGSGEFEPWSEEVERAALDGRSGPVAVVPAASASEGGRVFDRWAQMGLDHYASMGVEARVIPIKNREDAEHEDLARQFEGTSMIFFTGGKPRFLSSVIGGTRASGRPWCAEEGPRPSIVRASLSRPPSDPAPHRGRLTYPVGS